MAITKVDTQGTKIFVGASSASEELGCIQSIGSIQQSRPVNEITCINNDDTEKALGAIQTGALEVVVLLNPAATTGQKTVIDAFKNNDSIKVKIELSNKPDGGTNGTLYEFDARVSGISRNFEKDAPLTLSMTLEVYGEISETAAA